MLKMDSETIEDFINGLSDVDILEIVGTHETNLQLLRDKLALLNEHESECYWKQFKGNPKVKGISSMTLKSKK